MQNQEETQDHETITYDAIVATQVVIMSSLASLDWYGDVVEVEIDDEKGTVIIDDSIFTIDTVQRSLRKAD